MNMITKLLNAAASYRSYRNAYAQLSGLSDHMLADLGIMRHEIKAVAAGTLDVRAKRRTFEAAPVLAKRIADILPLNANTVLATEICQLHALPKAA